MITVESLHFEYPGVVALKDVSFSIQDGSITALVGPNGAGKTTLLRCLAALDEPLSGTIRFDSLDILQNPRQCHRMSGYLSDFFGLYDDLTVHKCLTYVAMAHGLPYKQHEDALQLAASRVGLSNRLDQKAGALSRGLRQRLAIAQAIIHEPRVLLLDEPASGLDPEARSELSSLFLGLRDQGMTLIVSSHIISELEEYSTDMLVLDNGRVVGHRPVGPAGETATLLSLELSCPSESMAEILLAQKWVSDIRVDGNRCRFSFTGDVSARHELLKELVTQGIPVCSFAEEKTDMQNEYMSVMRHGASSEGDTQ
jgi:ABC-2 type transport system ATP-binding protein